MASTKKGAKSAKKKAKAAPRKRLRRRPLLPAEHPVVRQLILMGECTVWALRVQEFERLGQWDKAKRARIMAQRYLKRAEAMEAERQKIN